MRAIRRKLGHESRPLKELLVSQPLLPILTSAFRLPWNEQVLCFDTLPTVICCLSIGKVMGPSNCGLKPLRLQVKEKIF